MCVYVCGCLQGVLQSQRYNGPTPSLREVLQNNPKQSTAAGREPWLACSWITSQGNSRYAISAARIPLGLFPEPLTPAWLAGWRLCASNTGRARPKTTPLLPLGCTTFHSSSPEQLCYCSDVSLKDSTAQWLCLQGQQFFNNSPNWHNALNDKLPCKHTFPTTLTWIQS